MDDGTSIYLFISWLRLLLRLMKVLLEYGLLGHAAVDCLSHLGLFKDGSDGAAPLLRFLLRVGYVERPETIVVW